MAQQQSHNHHYVPTWYQRRFLAPGSTAFRVLDLHPDRIDLPDGSVKYTRQILDKGPTAWFKSKDLYTVSLFGEANDDIERLLFGTIDTSGRRAIDAWLNENWAVVQDTYWQTYEFMDALRLRTPKGLGFVRVLGRARSKVELLVLMQQVRLMHCVMWAEGVLEIVSARDSPTKFIFTDHPVTLFNRYVFPGDPKIPAGLDPSQEWMGTQTLFPFDRDNLFVLTHIEWAWKAGESKARKPRTNARYFDQPMVRYDECGRGRTLTERQVHEVNYIMKMRAHRYVAARSDDELFPERHLKSTLWSNLGQFLMPPDHLYDHGDGEMFVTFKDGSHYFQDRFGRRPTTKAEFDRRVEETNKIKETLKIALAKDRAKQADDENNND